MRYPTGLGPKRGRSRSAAVSTTKLSSDHAPTTDALTAVAVVATAFPGNRAAAITPKDAAAPSSCLRERLMVLSTPLRRYNGPGFARRGALRAAPRLNLEPLAGIEPALSSLPRMCFTTKLQRRTPCRTTVRYSARRTAPYRN